MIVTHNFLEDMALVLCVAALATVICQLLRQPLLLGYLVAGMVVGPSVPGVYAVRSGSISSRTSASQCWFSRSAWSSIFAD
jgi:CPA2 family monovalent cation:H+ antiporter-2